MVKRSGDRFVDLVKNAYRVLLTRGMKGCYVYFENEDTRNFFRSRIAQPGIGETMAPSLAKTETALRGELHLQLSDELIEQLARVLADRLLGTDPEESETPRDLRAPNWWWEPVTQRETAAFLRTSSSTLSALRRSGSLPASDALGPRTPRFFRAQLLAWQLGLPIPLPPWRASTPMDWLWFPLRDREAVDVLGCSLDILEGWIRDQKLPCTVFPGIRYFFRAQLLAWILGKPVPENPRWSD